MKKNVTGILVAAVSLFAINAMAGFPGLPSSANKAIDKATEMGLEQAAADKIKQYNCTFADTAATSQTKCNNGRTFNDLVNELQGIVTTGSFTGQKVYLKATVEGDSNTRYARRDYIRNQLERIQKWYRISVYTAGGSGNRIDMSANAYK